MIYISLSLYIYIHISMDICLFPCFGYLNNVAMNTGVHSSLRDSDFTSSVYTFRGGIAGSYGRSISNFLRTCHTVPIYIPTNGAQSSLNSVSSPTRVSLFLYQIVFFHFLFLFYFILFLLFRAALMAYGDAQARGPIGATAVGLHHSHSNAGTESCL